MKELLETRQQFDNFKRSLLVLLKLEGPFRPAVIIEHISKLHRENAQLRSANARLRGHTDPADGPGLQASQNPYCT
jgi:hypothetical protein